MKEVAALGIGLPDGRKIVSGMVMGMELPKSVDPADGYDDDVISLWDNYTVEEIVVRHSSEGVPLVAFLYDEDGQERARVVLGPGAVVTWVVEWGPEYEEEDDEEDGDSIKGLEKRDAYLTWEYMRLEGEIADCEGEIADCEGGELAVLHDERAEVLVERADVRGRLNVLRGEE
ncbi:hypothetical protein CMI37_22655 [Candidatus Pacearchaeota archaeon]|nr:hypothetical protein [Candidatus Pacearchaeota archaeon]|tara:strand:- start:3143 stop:3664 length:522 start_codon:yes stop_codon:yes gene_type:complete